jgi:hypothetical protein
VTELEQASRNERAFECAGKTTKKASVWVLPIDLRALEVLQKAGVDSVRLIAL